MGPQGSPYRLGALLVAAALVASAAWAQSHHKHSGPSKTPAEPPASIGITMEELHAHGGVPPGWRFLLPPGDPERGRTTFREMECFACHEIEGEPFPRASRTDRQAGPALTGMGAHHPPEYFAESIVNPNRVIVHGPGFTGADGRSTMPDYAETMTLRQLIDLVAYLKSLTAGHGHPPGQRGSHGHMKTH